MLKDIIPNHVVTTNIDEMPEEVRKYKDQLEGRTMLVKKAKVIMLEAIVRGYITGTSLHFCAAVVVVARSYYSVRIQVLRGQSIRSQGRCTGSQLLPVSRNQTSSLHRSSRPRRKQSRVNTTRTSRQNKVSTITSLSFYNLHPLTIISTNHSCTADWQRPLRPRRGGRHPALQHRTRLRSLARPHPRRHEIRIRTSSLLVTFRT